MMSARWITAPALAFLVLSASWAWAAKDEPGVEEATAEEKPAGEDPAAAPSRTVPAGLPALPFGICLLYTSPSPRDLSTSRMPSSA